MRRPRTRLSTTLIGSIVLLVGLVAVTLSYNANRGLPFVPTYDISLEVPDAARLVAASSEVRIGGGRVGVVTGVEAVRPPAPQPPYARIDVALDPGQEGLPVDSTVAVRPRSLLGAKYVDIVPGRSPGTVPPQGTLPLRQAVAVVELSDTFDIFGPRPARALQRTVLELGDALAGRGVAINRTVEEVATGLPDAQRVLAALTAPSTDLDGLIRGLADTGRALEPELPRLGGLLENAATTIGALDAAGDAVGGTVGELAAIGREGTPALRSVRPVLADAAALARELRPAARRLPGTARLLAAALDDATPALVRLRALRRPAEQALATLGRVAAAPATRGALRKLTAAVTSVSATLEVLGPAQRHCNMLGTFVRNTASAAGQGDANGNWLTYQFIVGNDETSGQNDEPWSRAHVNPVPRLDAVECETGNEVFGPGRRIGNPEGVQRGTEETAPPPGVRERAAAAGLLDGPPPEARR